MNKAGLVLLIIVIFVIGLFAGMWSEGEGPWDDDDDDEGGGSNVVFDAGYEPDIDPAHFATPAANPYWPLTPGLKYTYEGEDEEGETVRVEIEIINETKVVDGVTCTIFREEEYVDGELEERTDDWFAADNDGNVWYFGEDTAEYEDGKVTTTAGAWESGKGGAYAGIVMLADPLVGMTYRQEFLADEAEDMGTVMALDGSVDTPVGTYTDCVVIQDSTPLEPGIAENKYFAAGVGMVKEEKTKGDKGYTELTAFSGSA